LTAQLRANALSRLGRSRGSQKNLWHLGKRRLWSEGFGLVALGAIGPGDRALTRQFFEPLFAVFGARQRSHGRRRCGSADHSPGCSQFERPRRRGWAGISTGLTIGKAVCCSSVVARPSQNCVLLYNAFRIVGALRWPARLWFLGRFRSDHPIYCGHGKGSSAVTPLSGWKMGAYTLQR
jgi:hypothetical protein